MVTTSVRKHLVNLRRAALVVAMPQPVCWQGCARRRELCSAQARMASWWEAQNAVNVSVGVRQAVDGRVTGSAEGRLRRVVVHESPLNPPRFPGSPVGECC